MWSSKIRIEQPFAENKIDQYQEFKKSSSIPVFIDETIKSQKISKNVLEICDGINFKVMKSGGPLNVISQLEGARELGLKCMLGCMVESSLSISNYVKMAHLFDYCDLDGNLFLEEDPFNMVDNKNGCICL